MSNVFNNYFTSIAERTKSNIKFSPITMSNVFNNYFTSIAERTKSNIKFSLKHFTDYTSNTSENT